LRWTVERIAETIKSLCCKERWKLSFESKWFPLNWTQLCRTSSWKVPVLFPLALAYSPWLWPSRNWN
jgi:hypothetical protein